MVEDSEIVLSEADIEALREIILFARDSSDGLGIRRQELCSAAGIRGGDLDNFITKDKTKGGYKTRRPNDRLLLRLLRFAASDTRVLALVEQGSVHQQAIQRLVEVYRSLKRFSPDDDHLYLYLNRIKAMNEEKCHSICGRFSGNYYGYRFSANKNKIIKSYFEMKPFDPTQKIPNFVHHLKYANGVTRLTQGQITEIGNHYIFMGYVCVSTYEYEGVKIIVVPKGRLGAADRFIGSLISYDGRIHETGFIQLVKTKDNYDANTIGEFSIDQLRTTDPWFDPTALQYDIASQVHVELDETGKIQHLFLIGSLAAPG